jgi:hypothetical protein
MFSVLFCTALLGADVPAKEPPAKKELFAKEEWYKNEKGKEEDFTGILKYTPPPKGVVGFGRTNPFRLEFIGKNGFREVYVGGKDEMLKDYAGKKVKLTGKAVDMEVEGRNHHEIWPARVEVLSDEKPKANPKASPANPAKDGDENPRRGDRILVPISPEVKSFLAPAPAAKELKVLARGAVSLPASPGAAPVHKVIRSAKELATLLRMKEEEMAVDAMKKMLKVDALDFDKQMIVVASAGAQSSGGYKFEITSLKVADDTLKVKWKLEAPQGFATNAFTHPNQAVLVEKFEGKVRFDPPAAAFDPKRPNGFPPEFFPAKDK